MRAKTKQRSETLPAVILLGHGSRIEKAGGDMELVAAILKDRHAFPLVEYCFMSRLPPHFPETLAGLVERGATWVLVIPYFLHTGLHIRLDIPVSRARNAAFRTSRMSSRGFAAPLSSASASSL